MHRTTKSSTNGTKPAKKATKRTTSATRTKKAKKELTANEALMVAWQDTYNKRHKRIA